MCGEEFFGRKGQLLEPAGSSQVVLSCYFEGAVVVVVGGAALEFYLGVVWRGHS